MGNAKTVGQTLMNIIFDEWITINRLIPTIVQNCYQDQPDKVYKTSNTVSWKIYGPQCNSLRPVLLFVAVSNVVNYVTILVSRSLHWDEWIIFPSYHAIQPWSLRKTVVSATCEIFSPRSCYNETHSLEYELQFFKSVGGNCITQLMCCGLAAHPTLKFRNHISSSQFNKRMETPIKD